ncbi:TetR/AcrR family transcriptional regulator [Frondihabitans peucedani]
MKRQQIVEAALEAYADSGATGPSLRTIAQVAGTTERALLHYFASRDDLFTQVLRERDRALKSGISEEPSVEELGAAVAREAEVPGLSRLFLEIAARAAGEPGPANEFFGERYRELVPLVAGVLNNPKGGGAAESFDPEWAARILVAAADGLQIQWLLDPTIDMQADLAALAHHLAAPDQDRSAFDVGTFTDRLISRDTTGSRDPGPSHTE